MHIILTPPTGLAPQAGRFLIAHPHMRDDYFGFTLIYLTKVNTKGCEGFVVNKMFRYKLNKVIPDIPIGDKHAIHRGGPVDTKSLYFLHISSANTMHSEAVNKSVSCGYEYNDLLAALDHDSQHCFCCLGYAGWDYKQLHAEIGQNDWLVADLDLWHLLQLPSKERWGRALGSLGYNYAIWKYSAILPDWN